MGRRNLPFLTHGAVIHYFTYRTRCVSCNNYQIRCLTSLLISLSIPDKTSVTGGQHDPPIGICTDMRKFTEGLIDTQLIVNTLAIKPGQTIIDAGCGTGYMSKIFSQAVSPSGKVYAIDRDSYFIRKLAGEVRGTNVEAIEGDIADLYQLPDHSADLLYASTVIHSIPKHKVENFVKEAKRVLKTKALLAIVEIEKKETPFGPAMENRYSPEELMQRIPMVPVETGTVGEHFYMQVFLNAEK